MDIPERPWLQQAAIEFLDRHLTRRSHVLEFGSGGSTRWFAQRVASVTAFESDPTWLARLANTLERDKPAAKVHLRLLELPMCGAVAELPDAAFDLVLIDQTDPDYATNQVGRLEVALECIRLVKPGGVLMLDNALRERYWPLFGLLQDWPCVSARAKPSDPPVYGIDAQHRTAWWIRPDRAEGPR